MSEGSRRFRIPKCVGGGRDRSIVMKVLDELSEKYWWGADQPERSEIEREVKGIPEELL